MTSTKTYKFAFIGLIIALLASVLLNVSLGSVTIPFGQLLGSFFGGELERPSWEYIIFDYRFPKAVTAILVGAGLGLSGLLMQTLFRNPLAGPFVLGISSGASLGVALLIMGAVLFGGAFATIITSSYSLAIAASTGSFLVLLAVMAVSIRVRDAMAILIIGLMFGSITASVVSILAYFSPAEQLQQYIFWSFGSIGDLSWKEVGIFSLICGAGIVMSIFSMKSLNSLLLGENYAKSIGLNVKRSRILIIIATSLLAGSITAFAGPIVFIGIAVPHLTRQIFDTSNHKTLVPAVVLYGAILMLLCDTIAQLPSSELTLPINAVTSIVGAPVVIWLLVRKRKMMF